MAKRCEESVYCPLDTTDSCCSSLIEQHQPNSTTGLLHCVMTRVKTATSLSQCIHPIQLMYKFYIEMTATHGQNSSMQLLLTGVKDSNHSYAIHSISTDVSVPYGMKIGSLARVQMNMYSISYVLKNSAAQSIAYIVYHVPSPIKVLRNPPSRFAELAVHDPISKTDTSNAYHKNDLTEKLIEDSTVSATNDFDKACTDSISRHHNLSGVVGTQHDDISIRVMQSMQPYISSSTGRATMNFRGRGKYASPKNMQLIPMSTTPDTKTSTTSNHVQSNTKSNEDVDTTATICMQMCKWEVDMYNVDFDARYITHFQAFAFGLAQMDI